MTRPTLSVVLCNYNHARYVERALGGILSQLRPTDDAVVIDDASTDGSREVITRLARGHPRVRLVENERNLGVHASFAKGLALARGDWINAAAADDLVVPGFFARAMEWAERHPQSGVVFGRLVAVDPEGRRLKVHRAHGWRQPLYASPEVFLRDYLEAESPTESPAGATVFRAAALREVGGFRAELGAWCDTFAFRAVGLRHGACYLPEDGVLWTILPRSISQEDVGNLRSFFTVIARAQALMRSPQFRDTFPEDHVRRWGEGYRARLLLLASRDLVTGRAPRGRAAGLPPLLIRHAPGIAAELVRDLARRRRWAAARNG